MRMTTQLLAVADAYCAATKLSRARVSTLVLNGGSRLDVVAAGGDVSTGTFERAMAWFSASWPEGTAWPEGIHRPDPAEITEAAE